MTDSVGGALEIHEITFDARDPHALAAFWAALLEREIRPGDMPQDDSVLVVPAPGQPGLLFLRVPRSGGERVLRRARRGRAGWQRRVTTVTSPPSTRAEGY